MIMKKMLSKVRFKKNLFVWGMLAYTVLHFIIFWFYVNIETIALSFQRVGVDITDPDTFGKTVWAGFTQYKAVFNNLANSKETQRTLLNSIGYLPVTLFELFMSVTFSYFLYKKMPLAGMFRVIYFLPSIIPIVVLTFVYRFIFDPSYGLIPPILKGMGMNVPNFFGTYPTNQIMVYIYCLWVGLGYNIILLSGAISRIPIEVMEYGQLDGISKSRELFSIVVPLVWPTITTTVIIACTSVCTVMLQPLMITPSDSTTNTIALTIYNGVLAGEGKLPYLSAFGLCITVVAVPVILLVRKLMECAFRDISF